MTDIQVGDWVHFKDDIEGEGMIVEVTNKWEHKEYVIVSGPNYAGDYYPWHSRAFPHGKYNTMVVIVDHVTFWKREV